ncbi:hypothetical protein [uncultured Psychroserpens sp.]|uniref:hypothetical protein n=1 Tax=uncultured Psychroserpens sp. TaxID=255436 RepID=UPI002616518F|nr:hypothetical protein [uncultured Psychroserpens sp.]
MNKKNPSKESKNRIFDPAQKKWVNTWVENSNNTMSGLWDATMKEDSSIEMHDGTRQWVIVFYNITKDTFDWKWDYLQADGTMKTVSKIKAKRNTSNN